MVSNQEEIDAIGETKARVLVIARWLKECWQVAQNLKIQKSAAMIHLETLQSLGAVGSKFKIEKIGRSNKVYELPKKAGSYFQESMIYF